MTDPVAVTEGYRRQTLRLRLTGAAALLAIWQALPSHDDTDVDTFAKRAVPLLGGLQAAAAALTAGYVVLLAGRDARPAVGGIVIDQDMRDPFIGVWKALKEGAGIDAALQAGANRVRSLADERVILTQRATAERADSSSKIVGWRRVPQGSTCSFCVRAATQRYRTARAAGNVGHRNKGREYCDCDVVPILGDADPGRVINRPMLDAWKDAQGDDAPAYFDATSMEAAPRPT